MSKGRKPRTSRPRPARGWSAVKPFAIALGTLILIVVGLLGLRELGHIAGLNLGNRERYQVRFADIDTSAPPGLSREAFLDEVRKASGVPETFQQLDPTTPERLKLAFEHHPWVHAVESVSTDIPASVRVRVRWRTPLLVVTAKGSLEPRVVDASGVLLPRNASITGLATLANPVTTPAPQDGAIWPDPMVKKAVELASAYQPTRLEVTLSGWKLQMRDGQELVVNSQR